MGEKQDRAHRASEPAPWVVRFLAPLEPGARVLDLACGGGRHLRGALARGHAVTGLDRDLSGVKDLEGADNVRLIEADLEQPGAFPLRGEVFDAVIVTNYLWRPILGDIAACVGARGLLVYETFARGNERCGKPKNPDYLLEPNELLEAFAPHLAVIAFEHGLAERPHPRLVQRLAACGLKHPWVEEAPFPVSLGP